MNSADLITSFFNNELSPDQEREFLLSVASSDSMRLGLKSHILLDRILIEENQQVEISPAVRRSILKEASVVAAVVAAGVGGLSSEAIAATEAASSAAAPGTSAGISGGFFGNWLAIPATLLVALGSFFFGYSVAEEREQSRDLLLSISVSQFLQAAASPVPFIYDRSAESEVMPNRSDHPTLSTASLRTSRSTGLEASDLSGNDDRTETISTVSDTAESSSTGSMQPNKVDPGTLQVNKGRRPVEKE